MTINYPPVSEREFLQHYLEFANLLLPLEQRLVPSEVDLMIEFALLPDEKFHYQRFGSVAKSKVIQAVTQQGKKLNKLNINNKLYGLLDKNFLRRDEDKVIYMPKHLLHAFNSFKKNNSLTVNLIFNGSIESKPNSSTDSE